MTVPKGSIEAADMLRLAVAAVLEADKEFRANMPPEWEGDPLSDEIDGLRRVYSALISSPGHVTALDEAEGPFHVSRTSDGKDHWFSARDEASGVSIPGKSKENAEALVYSLNRAFDLHLRLALASSPGKDGGKEDDRTEGFIAGYDEGLRQSKHEASIVATDALKQAQAVLKTIRRGALAPMGEVIAALTAIDHALEAAPSKETDQ